MVIFVAKKCFRASFLCRSALYSSQKCLPNESDLKFLLSFWTEMPIICGKMRDNIGIQLKNASKCKIVIAKCFKSQKLKRKL